MENEEILKDKRKKVIILSIIAVILIALIVLLVIKLVNFKTNKNEDENIIENETEENILEENITNEIVIDEMEYEEEKNENTNKYKSDNTPVADPSQEIDKKTFQKEKTNEEKAEEIVKKDWGNDNSVSIKYSYKDEKGRYVVKVSDSNTHVIGTYYVNINNGTFEKTDY